MFYNTKKENLICQKVIKLMEKNNVTNKNLVHIINKNSTKEVKSICTITLDRINEIVQGSTPSLIECTLIGQALGKDLSYFHYKSLNFN
ncbi:hypothetical protein NSA50_05135 [Clostridium sp. DSM 100503]|uniref:hypothetical protein n=1 Tax=Clostridium sp. DSM 100503 TaxID=2963282 RepID=UPI002149A114|nr:hypothetical protein [Clostridium sp. DSM 100503]MCR1950450.1 hypothetical protein [Clostridium sp. DSM 100503]